MIVFLLPQVISSFPCPSHFFRVKDDMPTTSGSCPSWDSQYGILLLLCKAQQFQLITFTFFSLCSLSFVICISFCVNTKTW